MRVTTIRVKGYAALVEYEDGGLKRAIVPRIAVRNNEVAQEDLESAIEYGVPWEEAHVEVTPDMAESLRKRGIWTIEDLSMRPQEVTAVIRPWLTYAALLKAARAWTGGNNG